MASSSRWSACLAALLLALSLAPLATAQATPSLSLTSDATVDTYAQGSLVPFTVTNTGTANASLVGLKLNFLASGSSAVTMDLPPTVLHAGGVLNVTWDSKEKPVTDYLSYLTDARGSIIGGSIHWTLHAASPPIIGVQAAGSGSYAAGTAIRFDVTNRGTSTIAGCSPHLLIKDAGNSVVYDSQPTALCPGQTNLSAGMTASVTWNGQTSARVNASAGGYMAHVEFGGASADVSFLLTDSGTSPGTSNGSGSSASPSGSTGSASVSLRLSATSVVQGSNVTAWLLNSGTADAQGKLTFRVRDAQNRTVYDASGSVSETLRANSSRELNWNQTDANGMPVPPGTYIVEVAFAGQSAQASVQVQARSATQGSTAAPPTATGSGGSAGSGGSSSGSGGASTGSSTGTAPDQPKPVVGTIAASVGGNFSGTYVSFRLDAQTRELLDFRVGGVLLFSELQLPGSGTAVVVPGTGEVRVQAQGMTLTIFDNPSGALRLDVPGGAAQLGLQAAPGIGVRASSGNVTFDAPGLESLLFLRGAGRVEAQGGKLTVLLDPQAQGAGVTFRAGALASVNAPAQATLDVALPNAIAHGRVAAEAFLATNGSGPQLSVVPYAGDVQLNLTDAQPGQVQFKVDVAQHEAKTLVFHLGAGVLASDAAHVRVLLDGVEVRAADNLTDVLDPDNDGLQAEAYVVADQDGLQLLVSVPHFSEHTLTVQGTLAEVAQNLAPYGLLLGVLAMVGAGAYMMRKPRP